MMATVRLCASRRLPAYLAQARDALQGRVVLGGLLVVQGGDKSSLNAIRKQTEDFAERHCTRLLLGREVGGRWMIHQRASPSRQSLHHRLWNV